jgi:hypothetical protein
MDLSMGYGSALLLIFVAIVGWNIVIYTARQQRPKDAFRVAGGLPEVEGDPPPTIVDPLISLQRENPDLPVVPSSTAVYEVWEIWFREAIRRVALGSTRRTREETLKLNDQLLRYQLQCLTYLKNRAAMREAGELADLEFEAKKKDLLLRIARSDAEIRDLNNPDRPRPHIDV